MTDVTAGGATRPVYSNGYKALVLAMLVAAYTFNFIDRLCNTAWIETEEKGTR